MPTQAAALLVGARPTLVFAHEGTLYAGDAGARADAMAKGLGTVQHLVASADGRYLAYFSDERIRLVDAGGERIWSHRINTDKADVHDIRFTPMGDALGCFDDYDGLHRLHLYRLDRDAAIEFTQASSPIAADAQLRRFVIANRTSPEEKARHHTGVAILDRRKTLRGVATLPLHRWRGAVVDRAGDRVILACSDGLVLVGLSGDQRRLIPFSIPGPGYVSVRVCGAHALAACRDRRVWVDLTSGRVLLDVRGIVEASLFRRHLMLIRGDGLIQVLSEHLTPVAELRALAYAAGTIVGDELIVATCEGPGEKVILRRDIVRNA